jgi:uncharacterized protein YlaI
MRKHVRKVSVRCTHCGDFDQINDRSYRRKLADGKPHLCSICRAVKTIKPNDDDRHYWTSRFSQQEIEAMVSAIL